MGKKKFIPPIPNNVEELLKRVVELEEANVERRARKAKSMQRYREKVRRGRNFQGPA